MHIDMRLCILKKWNVRSSKTNSGELQFEDPASSADKIKLLLRPWQLVSAVRGGYVE